MILKPVEISMTAYILSNVVLAMPLQEIQSSTKNVYISSIIKSPSTRPQLAFAPALASTSTARCSASSFFTVSSIFSITSITLLTASLNSSL